MIVVASAALVYPSLILYSTLGWFIASHNRPRPPLPPDDKTLTQLKKYVSDPAKVWQETLASINHDLERARTNPDVVSLKQYCAIDDREALDSEKARMHCQSQGYRYTARVRGDNNCGFYSIAVILALSRQPHLSEKIKASIEQTKKLNYRNNAEFTTHVEKGFSLLLDLAKGKTWNELHMISQDPANFSAIGLACRLIALANILADEETFFNACNLNDHGLLNKEEGVEPQRKQNIEGLTDFQGKQVDMATFLFLPLLWNLPLPFITTYGPDYLTLSPENPTNDFAIYRSGGHYHPLFKSAPH